MSWEEDEGQETTSEDCPQDWDPIEDLLDAFAACNGYDRSDEE